MKKRGWQVLFLTLAALLALALVLPASADGPVKIVVPYEAEYEMSGVCGSPIQVVDSGTLTLLEWSDELGVSRQIYNFNLGRTTYTGPSGVTLTPNTMGTVRFEVVRYEDESLWVSKVAAGPGSFVVLPGQGPVYGSAGRTEWLLHIFFDGREPTEELVSQHGGLWTNTEALCDYLGAG